MLCNDDLSDPVIDVLVDRACDIQAPPSLELIVEHMGGAIAAGARDEVHFFHA